MFNICLSLDLYLRPFRSTYLHFIPCFKYCSFIDVSLLFLCAYVRFFAVFVQSSSSSLHVFSVSFQSSSVPFHFACMSLPFVFSSVHFLFGSLPFLFCFFRNLCSLSGCAPIGAHCPDSTGCNLQRHVLFAAMFYAVPLVCPVSISIGATECRCHAVRFGSLASRSCSFPLAVWMHFRACVPFTRTRSQSPTKPPRAHLARLPVPTVGTGKNRGTA